MTNGDNGDKDDSGDDPRPPAQFPPGKTQTEQKGLKSEDRKKRESGNDD